MQPSDCYRILGLSRNANWEDIKIAYRRLARKYHPDVNQGDPQAVDKFRRVQEAYQMLRTIDGGETPEVVAPQAPAPKQAPPPPKVKVEIRTPAPKKETLSPEEKLLVDTIKRIQDLLRQRKYPVAIAMVEGLRQRFPTTQEVIHWQAVCYQRYGNELILLKKLREAESYLQKALKSDPSNRELCFEVKHDLDRLTQTRQS